MKKVTVSHRCSDFDSFRAAYVKSLFNVESGANFALTAELPDDTEDWQIGVIVGPSGSGKTSLGSAIWDDVKPWAPRWPKNQPIIDAIGKRLEVKAAAATLSAVGLGSVPSWLRPYQVLSNGEKFRADLARLVCDAPDRAVVDEFSSVVDRQIAKVGALAFGKAWRRTGGRAVLLSCHYDILEWLQPDWWFDTADGSLNRRALRRPKFRLDIYETDWRYWHLFEPHHYLKLPKMIAARNYVGVVNGELVAHLAVSTRPGLVEARACRLVVMPEWQGAGVGLRFLNAVCERWLKGENRFGLTMPMLFHTSHPGLADALRRQPGWTQVSGALHGSRAKGTGLSNATYGGHWRAVQGFRYIGRGSDV